MARKVVNRKELRDQATAADAIAKAGGGDAAADEAADGKKKAKKAPAKRKSRAKNAEPERKRLFWAVYNQSMKQIALFDFTQKKAAEAKAVELSTGSKSQHFVMKKKEAIQ